MKKRFIKLSIVLFVILVAGLLYAWLVVNTGISYPCIFHEITGLYDPGDGITRMFISLLKLEFYQAFRYNPAVMILSPYLAYYIILRMLKYIKGEKYSTSKTQSIIWIIIAIIMILFGILRNIPQFDYLAPTKI